MSLLTLTMDANSLTVCVSQMSPVEIFQKLPVNMGAVPKCQNNYGGKCPHCPNASAAYDSIPMGSYTGQVLQSKCVPFIFQVGTTRGSRPRWITVGAGPHIECLSPRWIMIGAGPLLVIGLGLRLGYR